MNRRNRLPGNLFAGLSAEADPAAPGGEQSGRADERFDTLLATEGVTIERIVSHGTASPPGFWYDQDKPEWVLLVAGAAAIQFEGEDAPRPLRPGDHVHIPAHARHRVAWTHPSQPTIWLAVHYRVP